MNASTAFQVPFLPSHALDKQQLKPIFESENSNISHQPTDPKAISYLPGEPSIGLEESTVNDYLSRELKTYLLDELYGHLWLVGRRSGRSIDALHTQRLKGRSVVPTEDPSLHLIWHRNQIYIKPIPVCLFNYRFWDIYLRPTKNNNHQTSSTFDPSIAMGFLRSYAFLTPHRLDFILAKESHLIPEDIDWIAWSRFIHKFRELSDEQVAQRYHYGQLRLSRLNWAVRIVRPQHANTLWFYHLPHWSITSYLSQATVPLLFIFASVSVVLSAMQVVVSVPSDKGFLQRLEDAGLPQMKLTFWAFSISILLLSALIWVLLLGVPLGALAWQLSWGFRKREREKGDRLLSA